MKKTILTLAIVITSIALYAQVKISTGGGNPHGSAGLEVDFNNKGFLPPRMTTAQRNAIASPADGLIIFNTSSGCINIFNGTSWRETCPTAPLATITTLFCAGATHNGTLTSGIAASGVNSVVAYTGGNGESHNGQTVTSTGVIGLTATLTAGTFANGAGTLTYTITGTPSATGTASFALNIGGQSCTLTRTVAAPPFTCGTSTITDIDNNTYNTVLIGTQCWMKENLNTTKTSSGTAITRICYGNNSANCTDYGGLYNWATVMNGSTSSNNSPSGVQGICPTGWHLPSLAEWTSLRDNLGGANAAGGNMKSTSNQWTSPNTDANNSSGFTGLPGGRSPFTNLRNYGYFHSSTEFNSTASSFLLLSFNNGIADFSDIPKTYDISVRCIKD